MKEKITKEKLLKVIKEKLKETEIPDKIILDSCTIITNPKKFFDLHLYCIGFMQKNNISDCYVERLKLALKKLNIDLNELAKTIKDAENN